MDPREHAQTQRMVAFWVPQGFAEKKLNFCPPFREPPSDPEKAREAKERGNELFKLNKYPDAIREYDGLLPPSWRHPGSLG